MGKMRRSDLWWDRTWNPITGCSRASEGCRSCWAERFAHRFYYREYGPAYFEPRFHPERLKQPDAWRVPRRIFTCGMGDLFHEAVPAIWIAFALDRVKLNPQHEFFVLTKRPDRARKCLCENLMLRQFLDLPNLWLGVSVENQEWADKRIPVLLQIPVQHHFVSIEPMLGPVMLQIPWNLLNAGRDYLKSPGKRCLRWVILGAETGPGARPMNLDWARSVRDQCKAAGVPFWFKSAGLQKQVPADLEIRESPVP